MKLDDNSGAKLTAKAREVGNKVRTARAVSRAVDLSPITKEPRASGVTSLRGICRCAERTGHTDALAAREMAGVAGPKGADADRKPREIHAKIS